MRDELQSFVPVVEPSRLRKGMECSNVSSSSFWNEPKMPRNASSDGKVDSTPGVPMSSTRRYFVGRSVQKRCNWPPRKTSRHGWLYMPMVILVPLGRWNSLRSGIRTPCR